MFVGIAEAIAWLAGAFRKKFPRVAFYLGTVVFWLCILAFVWCVGISGYLIYEGAPIKTIGTIAGLGVFYGLLGWGIRHALTP